MNARLLLLTLSVIGTGAAVAVFGDQMSSLGDALALGAATLSLVASAPLFAPVAAVFRRPVPGRSVEMPLTHFDLGYRAFTAGDFATAIAELEHVLGCNAGDLDARYYLGLSLAGIRRHEEAVAALRQVIERRPRDARAHYHLAFSLAGSGQYFSARRAMHEALRLDPRITRAGHSDMMAPWWETIVAPELATAESEGLTGGRTAPLRQRAPLPAA